MNFEPPDDAPDFLRLWGRIKIVRKTPFTLFTFGETALPYKLVLEPKREGGRVVGRVGVKEGEITVARPTIITPDNAGPRFRGFFEDDDDGPSFDPGHGYDDGYPNTAGNLTGPAGAGDDDWDGGMGDGEDGERVVRFLMSRGVKFGDVTLAHRARRRGKSTAGVQETVDRLRREHDEEDDRTAILLAPHGLGGVALVRYAAECIIESAPGNVGELRERGFLP